MNEPYDPSDPSDPPDPSELEQRLLRCRPRSPILDIEAIVQLADDEAPTAQIAASRSDRSQKFLTPQFVGSIAASWVCGAIVGATCIVLLSSGQEQAVQNRNTTASNIVDVPKVLSPTESPIKSLESIANSINYWPIDLNTEALQVGMSLPSRGLFVRVHDRSIDSHSGLAAMKPANTNRMIEDDSDSVLESHDSRFTPSKPMTNAELLKELSGDARFRIH